MTSVETPNALRRYINKAGTGSTIAALRHSRPAAVVRIGTRLQSPSVCITILATFLAESRLQGDLMEPKDVGSVYYFGLLVLAVWLGFGNLWLAAQGAPQTAQAGAPHLEDGTPINVRLSHDLSSATAQTNDRVDFEVVDEIKVGSLVVIPKGSLAWGTVTEAQAKRRMGKAGKLDVSIDSVRLADGEKARLRGVKDTKGGGHTGAMTGGMVATGIVFFPAAPLFLLMHGKDVTIPAGTQLTVYVDGDFAFDPVKFGGHAAPGQHVATPTAAAAPTIVLVEPSVTESGETVDVGTPTLTIRGVVTDPSGIPAVTINGNPVAMRPKGPQAAAFVSEPIKLQSGETEFDIVATDAAHAQAKMTFVARYAPTMQVSKRQTTVPAGGKSLTKAEILGLLQGGVPSARVASLVEQRGIGFAPTDHDLQEIRAAGGGDDLINGLRKAGAGM
jgi:hypothetical protein